MSASSFGEDASTQTYCRVGL